MGKLCNRVCEMMPGKIVLDLNFSCDCRESYSCLTEWQMIHKRVLFMNCFKAELFRVRLQMKTDFDALIKATTISITIFIKNKFSQFLILKQNK